MAVRHDYTLLLLVLALFVFHSPFARWWASLGLPWYTVYLLWAAVIALVAYNQIRDSSAGGD
jgi:hypothetical protein